MVKSNNLIIKNDSKSVQQKIYTIRGIQVMLDSDLAELYGVETKVFNQTVKRNMERFPDNFRFQLTKTEYQEFLRSQFVTSKQGRGGRRYAPYAFTQEGVAMLSSVLNSERAVQVNIQIMRAFIKLRQMLVSNEELRIKIEKMEKKYDAQFRVVFCAIKQLLEPDNKIKRRIGYLGENKKD